MLVQKGKGGFEIAFARRHDEIDRRIALIRTEVVNPVGRYFQVPVTLAVFTASRGWPPRWNGFKPIPGRAAIIKIERRHPGREIGERRFIQPPVRIIGSIAPSIAPNTVEFIARTALPRLWRYVAEWRQHRADLLDDVGRQQR